MSYKKDSKSRLARFMLALTIMGGVGQRLADNKSSAAWLTKYSGGREQMKRTNVDEIDFVSGGPLLQVVEFEKDLTTKPSKGQDTGTAEARLFEKIMIKGVTRVGEVNYEGKLVQKDNYNNDEVKELLGPALKGVFSDKILTGDNGRYNNLSTRDYVFGICGGDPWDVDIVQKFNDMRDSVKNSAAGAGKNQFFTTNVQVNDGGAETKVKQMAAIKEELKNFANGLSGSSILPPQGGYNSYIRISKDGSQIKFANGKSGGKDDYYYLYSSARFTKLSSLEINGLGNALSALIGKLASYEDVAGNYLKVGGSYYKLGNGSFDGKNLGSSSYRPLAMFQAIHEFKMSGDLEVACHKYNEALAVGDRLAGVLAEDSLDVARSRLAADFDNFVSQGSIKEGYKGYRNSAVKMVIAFAKIYTAQTSTRNSPEFDSFVSGMSEGDFNGFLNAVQAMYGLDSMGITASDLKDAEAMDCCFKFLSLKAGFEVSKGGEERKEKKSSVLKPILWGAGILAFLGGSGVALWKTGYGEMLAEKAKEFFNKNKDRFASGGNSKPVDTKPVTGKPNPVPKKPN
ncbi:MAG: hypothetical protein J6P21_02585 [Clostridia bacterium]|nr:hypothetical protein [Clostridia bacterium]